MGKKVQRLFSDWWAAILAVFSPMIEILLQKLGVETGTGLTWGLGLFLVFCFVQMLKPQFALNKIRGTSPNVEVLEINKSIHTQFWMNASTGQQSSYQGTAVQNFDSRITAVENTEFTHILFVNNKERNVGVRSASNVIARIMFFDINQNPVIEKELDGRWDVPEPTDERFRREPGVLLEVEIPNNTRPRRLTVLVKRSDSPVCYAYAHNWYNASPSEIANYALPQDEYYLKVVLVGTDFYPDPYWFRLVTGQKGVSADLKLIEKPKGFQ